MRCYKCVIQMFHFFHDDGSPVTGKLKADPKCWKCYSMKPHKKHDRRAYNTNRAYRGGQ